MLLQQILRKIIISSRHNGYRATKIQEHENQNPDINHSHINTFLQRLCMLLKDSGRTSILQCSEIQRLDTTVTRLVMTNGGMRSAQSTPGRQIAWRNVIHVIYLPDIQRGIFNFQTLTVRSGKSLLLFLVYLT